MGHAAPHVAEAQKLDIEPAQIPRQRMVGLIVMDPLRSLQAAIRDLAVSNQLHTALLLLSLPCQIQQTFHLSYSLLSMPNITLVTKIFVAEVNHCSQCHLTSGRTDGPCKPFSNEPKDCINQAETNYCSSDMNAFVKCKISGKELLIN